jgi:hypothetical protein
VSVQFLALTTKNAYRLFRPLIPEDSEACHSCQELNLELKALFRGIKMYFLYQKSVASELHFSMVLQGYIFTFLDHTMITKCG